MHDSFPHSLEGALHYGQCPFCCVYIPVAKGNLTIIFRIAL